jgi:hypothetical protein
MIGTYGYKHTLRICNTALPLQQWLHERALIFNTRTLPVFLEIDFFGLMPNPQTGGAGFHFGVYYPREIGKRLWSFPCPLFVGHCLAPLLETCPVWVTLPVATLPLA